MHGFRCINLDPVCVTIQPLSSSCCLVGREVERVKYALKFREDLSQTKPELAELHDIIVRLYLNKILGDLAR